MDSFGRFLLQNQSTGVLREIPFVLRDSSDVEVTGAVLTGAEIQLSKNGGAYANFAGSVAEVGNGLYTYSATAAELDTLGYLDVRIDDGANITTHVFCQVVATDLDAAVAGVWGAILENGLTAQSLMRLIAAAVAGELTGAATTNVVIKSADDNGTTRIDATVDPDGNRTVITLTP